MDSELNLILFIMIGLDLMLLPFLSNYGLTGQITILVVLITRLISSILPAISLVHKASTGNLVILT